LCPVMEGSAGRKARSDQMRIDSLAKGGARSFADQAVKRGLAKRPTASAEPEPAC